MLRALLRKGGALLREGGALFREGGVAVIAR